MVRLLVICTTADMQACSSVARPEPALHGGGLVSKKCLHTEAAKQGNYAKHGK